MNADAPKLITLSCPSCGGKLQITSDMDRFACGHCGNEHIVRRSGGTISLAPVVEGLKYVQKGVDRTASELAIVRLKSEINELTEECDEMESEFIKKQDAWTRVCTVCVIGAILAIMLKSSPWAIVLGALAIGMFVGRQITRDNGQIMQTEELIRKREEELEYQESIVRHN